LDIGCPSGNFIETIGNACISNPRHFVESGEDAINYLVGLGPYSNREEYPLPALVLLDLKRPGMHGLEVLKWIRGHRHFQDLRGGGDNL
jgi:CheY-like chemotaxis protein